MELREHVRIALSFVQVGAFLRVVLMEVVYLKPRKLLMMLAMWCIISSCWIMRAYSFLDRLPGVVMFVCFHLVLCCVSV